MLGPKEVPTDPSNALWSWSKTPRARRGGPFRSHVPGKGDLDPYKAAEETSRFIT